MSAGPASYPTDRRRLLMALALGPALLWRSAWSQSINSPLVSTALGDLVQWEGFGWHWTGSDAEREAGLWLARRASDTAVPAQVQRYAFESVNVNRCSLVLGARRFQGLPFFDSAPTGSAGVTGTLGTVAEGGPIAIALSRPGAVPEAIAQARTDPRIKALVLITDSGISGLSPIDTSQGAPGSLPIIEISSEYGAALFDAATHRSGATVTSVFEREPSSASNVIGTLVGSDPTLAPLIVCAFHSSWGPAVGERGGALVAWLAVASTLSQRLHQRTCILLSVSGAEIGQVGVSAAIQQYPQLANPLSSWLILDENLGARSSALVLRASDSALLTTATARLSLDFPETTKNTGLATVPQGSSTLGAPVARFLALSGSRGALYHNPQDLLPRAVDLPMLEKISLACATIALELSNT